MKGKGIYLVLLTRINVIYRSTVYLIFLLARFAHFYIFLKKSLKIQFFVLISHIYIYEGRNIKILIIIFNVFNAILIK